MPSPLHPLSTDIVPPERFNNPFCYEPHPLCLLAAEEVKQEIERINPTEGKMFGVLVVKQRDGSFVTSSGVTKEPSLCYIAAYSGLLEGRNDWPYFVPPVFDAQDPNGHFKIREREISLVSQSTLHASKKMSQDLQLWLFHQYQFLNAKGETKDLVDVWQDYHSSPRIQKKYPLPPGGTGDCCAPKLLQYAYQNNLKPLCMAEFWWGPSPKSEIRHHGEFYPACRGKCKPVLTWMLQGLDVDPGTERDQFSHLVPEVVYEDEAIAVVNKPAGLLSIPGRTEDYSVATWAQQRWPGSLPAHRLDMCTSGILLIAKTTEAYQNLQKQFTEHTVKKKYLALVEGVPKKEHGVIDLPLLFDPMNRPRQVVDFEHGKRTITEYRVVTITPPQPLLSRGGERGGVLPTTRLALWPHTGRTHQLRMHCAHPDGLGCPIVGDELYGHASPTGLCLQAQAISFDHPTTGKRIHFELPNIF